MRVGSDTQLLDRLSVAVVVLAAAAVAEIAVLGMTVEVAWDALADVSVDVLSVPVVAAVAVIFALFYVVAVISAMLVAAAVVAGAGRWRIGLALQTREVATQSSAL